MVILNWGKLLLVLGVGYFNLHFADCPPFHMHASATPGLYIFFIVSYTHQVNTYVYEGFIMTRKENLHALLKAFSKLCPFVINTVFFPLTSHRQVFSNWFIATAMLVYYYLCIKILQPHIHS